MRNAKLLLVSIAAVLALTVGAAACSSSGSDSDKETTTTKADSKDDTSTEPADEEDDTPTTVVATGGGTFCKNLASYINENAVSEVDPTDPAAYKKAIETVTAQAEELLDEAPDEVHDSLQTLLDAQDTLITELEKVDFDYTKVPTEVLSSMSTPEVEGAQEELQAYAADTCGIDISSPDAEAPDVTAATIAGN